jgi:hypothetical protein
MLKNEILVEFHKYSGEYAQSFHCDLRAIFNDLKQNQLAHKDEV